MLLPVTRLRAVAAAGLLAVAGPVLTAQAQTITPTWQWATRGASSGPTTASAYASQVQADAAGNTYTAGSFGGTLTLGTTSISPISWTAGYVVKQTPGGSVSWARALASADNIVFIRQLAIDAAGNSYVAGEFIRTLQAGTITLTDTVAVRTGEARRNGFVVKLDALGQPQWAVRLGSAPGSSSAFAQCEGLAADAAGNVVVSGFYDGSVELAGQVLPPVQPNSFNFLVARLRDTGAAQPTVAWARTATGLRTGTFMPVALSPLGDVYVGTSVGAAMQFGQLSLPAPPNGPGTAVVKYNANGIEQWAQALPSALPINALSSIVAPAALVANVAGVYLLTSETNQITGAARRVQLAQFSPQGVAGWRHTYGSLQPSSLLQGLATDADNNLYVAAGVLGDCTLGPLTLRSSDPANREAGVFSFTAGGAPRWATLVSSGTGPERLTALAATAPDELVAAGAAAGAAQLGPVALPATGTADEHLTGRLSVAVITGTRAGAASALQLAPNPAHAFATLTLPAAAAAQSFALLDALGRPVRHYAVPAGATTARLEVAGLPAGLYVLHGAGASRKLVLE